MRSPGVPQAFTCGLVMLLVVGCTGDTEDPEPQPEDEPAPIPTEFEGDPPPGIEGELLRYLHGEGAEAPDILNDPMGVRISPVGAAFLISSDGEDRHLLHDAATGETLWEDEARFRGFAEDRDGERVMLMADTDDVPFVLDARGERVWSPEETGDTYLDGVVVRYPDEWSFDEPDGEYTVLDAGGDVLWEYEFTHGDADEDETSEEDAPEDEPSEDTGTEDEGTDADTDSADDEPGTGVPVAAREDLLLLSDGGAGLQARSLDPDSGSEAMGEELWAVSGHDEDLGLPASGPLPAPQVVGVYPAIEDPDEEGDGDEGDTGASDDASDSDSASGSDGSGSDADGEGSEESGEQSASDSASGSDADPDADSDQVVLLRWALAESPSTLSAHDADSGELLWTLREPGTNPVGRPFDPAGLTGSLHDAATGTLMLPQASGEATAIAVDTATGEVLWTLEDDDVSISLAFAHDGMFYGDIRTNDDQDEQLVLDALTMDTVSDELTSYVEAVTESGHAVLVQDRQRFVYGPPPQEGTDDTDASADPEDDPSADPTEEPT
ncbi:putative pyrroloquinoline-quinone binding quinoprotein [Nocardiopsis sp. Huas11]|uniref:outer membrane protein assembly factor BamB family protein n=1 Tax=Nocardiopsis sp. Huas11 TaxID=2183912 RepID=UPI000EAB5628|nr:PQQ-binding-like beta-propeller repeat protein [Nocardiopsis sp. Huas11]RKS06212.1 putative pyrroloquinoline-quinone binding quinoprotein [Nocardiopsis sp. Huas11]